MDLISLFFIAIYIASIPFGFRALVKDLKRDLNRKYLKLVEVIYCALVSLIPGINTLYVLWYITSANSTIAQMRFFEDKE